MQIRKPYERVRCVMPHSDENVTDTSFGNDTDVNNIVARFQRTGHLPPAQGEPQYADVTGLQKDLTTMVVESQKALDELKHQQQLQAEEAQKKQTENALKAAELEEMLKQQKDQATDQPPTEPTQLAHGMRPKGRLPQMHQVHQNHCIKKQVDQIPNPGYPLIHDLPLDANHHTDTATKRSENAQKTSRKTRQVVQANGPTTQDQHAETRLPRMYHTLSRGDSLARAAPPGSTTGHFNPKMKTDYRKAHHVASKIVNYDNYHSVYTSGSISHNLQPDMTCVASRPAWRTTYPNEKGNHEIRFQFRSDREPDYFIDCGKCEGCRARQKRDWAVRIAHEAQMYDRNCFVTLTYDDEHCPETIIRNDVVKFVKRLRKESGRKIRYYAVGEYGERTRRPHYHAILFNEDFLGGSYDIDGQLYGNPYLQQLWKNGTVAIAPFTFATAMYTAGYTTKKINDPDTFSLQSRCPPIGREWVIKNHDNIRRNENVVINGQEMPIPKVYLNWLKGIESFDHIKENLTQKIKPLNDQKLRAKKLNMQAQQNLRNDKC